MAERIADLRITVAVELIFGRALRACAGGQRALVDRVNVFDVHMDRDGWALRTFGA